MRLKIGAAIALVAVGLGAAGLVILSPGGNGTDSATYLTAQAEVTDVTQEAVASGTIAAASTYALSFGASPEVTSAGSTSSTSSTTSASAGGSGSSTVTWPVSAVNVALGDVVKAGDVLATADPVYADLQLTIAQANLDAAEAKLKSDLAGADKTTRATAKDAVTQANLQLAQARQSYTDTVRENALAVSQARAAVTAASAQLKKDRAADAPEQTIEADKKALQQAKQSLASTQLRASTSNHQAANQVTNAKQAVVSAKHNYAKQVAGATDEQIASDEAAVATATAALASAQTAVEHATITAPVDGRITAVNVTPGSVAPSGAAITMQSAALAVTASFTEDDILSLEVGQKATIAVSATDATVTGTVAAISPTASGTSGSSVVSYAVTILLDTGAASPSATSPGTAAASSAAGGSTATTAAASPSPGPAASTSVSPLPGMSAEVAITIAQVTDVVAVPAAAVSGTNGQYVVRVLGADGQVQSRSVEVGLITSSMAEIRSGLAAGDSVVTGTSADQVTTTTTSSGSDRGQFPGGLPGTGIPVGPPGGGS